MCYATIDQVKVGTVLVTDGGFTCLPENVERVVKGDPNGHLYINCDEGEHYLDGQLGDFNDDGHGNEYVGLRLA